MSCISTRLVSLTLAFAWVPFAGAQGSAPAGYRVGRSLPLTAAENGVNGHLVLWQDSRLTPRLKAELWQTGEPDETDEQRASSFSKSSPARPALLQVIGVAGEVIDAKTLEHSLARMSATHLYGDGKTTFMVTADYSAGFGSYSGPITWPVEVIRGRLQWLQSYDRATGKVEEISLMSSLKTTWKLVRGTHGEEILLAQCRPDWGAPLNKDPDFHIRYIRIYWTGKKWISVDRTVPGYSDFEDGFPRRSLFR